MVAILKIILLAAHLMCVNISAAGPLFCVYWNRRGNAALAPRSIVQTLALWCNLLLLAGILLGLALGLLAGGRAGSVSSVLPLFAYKIRWGILELGCSLVWMAGYWAWLKWRPPSSAIARLSHSLLAVLSATNLLYHFPPLLTVMVKAAHGEIELTEPITAATFRQHAFAPDVLAHMLHFWWASVAVAGVFLFWLVRKDNNAQRYWTSAARIGLVATLLQIPTGMWLLFVSPPKVQLRLMQGDWGTLMLLFSLGAAFYLMQALSSIALGDPDAKSVRRCTILMLATIVLMTGTLHFARM